MPRETELLHTETRLASLIKLVVAWLSHKRSTSLRSNTKTWCQKPQSRKAGFAWPPIWVAIDIPSTHRSTKRNGAKEPSFFHINTTGRWVQNKATNKNECCEGRGKEGKMRRMGEKNSHWHVGPDLEKVELFGPFVGNSRGRIQVGTEAHHVLRFSHWKSDERAKTQAERLMKPLKSNENTSSITESKAFFSGAFALSVFSVPGSFCRLYKWTCYRAPLLTSLSEKGKTQIRRCTQLHESVPECGRAQHILTRRSTRPHSSRSRKIPGITVNRTISYFIAGKNRALWG